MAQPDYVKRLEKIISAHTSDFGFCSFDCVKDSLISCRAMGRIPDDAQGIVTLIFPYALDEQRYKGSNLSMYACVADYHTVALNILERICNDLRTQWQGEQFVPFADNSPIPEVRVAALSGLGVIGRNGLLINRKYGSWVFIGEIVTTLCLESSGEIHSCSGCGLCENKCPTGALSGGRVDKSKCLSEITQRKGELTDEQKLLIRESGCAWGCDVCQLVCPHNKDVKSTYIDEFINSFLPLADAESLENKAYGWRGRAVIDRNIKLLED